MDIDIIDKYIIYIKQLIVLSKCYYYYFFN